MKYKIQAYLRRISAIIMSFIMGLSIFGDNEVKPVERPDANSITAYSTEDADYRLTVDVEDKIHDISDMLFGVFFEDINFAADGGLYAEKIINRSFEYFDQAKDKKAHGWTSVGTATWWIDSNTEMSLNANNPSYLCINNSTGEPGGVANRGFLDGMNCVDGETYNFSMYARRTWGASGKVYVNLMVGSKVAASAVIDNVTDRWEKYELSLTSGITANEGVSLQVKIDTNQGMAFDMISLFPEDTYKGRKNGLRKDLAEMVEAIEPKFLRFPGGCIIEGVDYDSAYNWKASIGTGPDGLPLEFNGKYGDVAARPYGLNLWTNLEAVDDPLPCFMSYGLGFFEYFQFAEDIGAVGVPVLNCGLNCQARGRAPVDMESDEFKQYLQDMLDLVEFCRGDTDTNWGKVRASLGHPEPFELKYICIGNENEGEVFYERYEAFLDLFLKEKANNPELYEGLELIYSSGLSDGTHSINYVKSYENAKQWLQDNPEYTVNDFAGATDQHYYNQPSWFLDNTDYYDEVNYARSVENMTDKNYGGAIGVFVGEYAAKSNSLEAALAEAAYMTGLERNGDIVKMAAYAPLFGNLTATHWAPDLIWFNNNLCTGSINYYVQKLFSNNAGTSLLKSELDGALITPDDLKGKIGVGTWYTTAEYDNIKVTDNKTGKVLDKNNFALGIFDLDWSEPTSGEWKIKNGVLQNTEEWMSDTNHGAVTFYGDDEWSNYTYSVDCKKTGGSEGFIIPFAVKDVNNYIFWNIGGWGNTKSCLQRFVNGEKTWEIPGTVTDFTVEEGKTYNIKIEVDGIMVRGYIDDVLQFEYQAESTSRAEAYQVVSTDETGDTIIKLVNVTGEKKTFAIDLQNAEGVKSIATVNQVYGDSLNNDNILGAKEDCIMEEFTVEGVSGKFNYTVPQYSVTAIRIHK